MKSIKSKLLLFALVPFLLGIVASMSIAYIEADRILDEDTAYMEELVLNEKKMMLENNMEIAKDLINNIISTSSNIQIAKKRIQEQLQDVRYMDDESGYYFAYEERDGNYYVAMLPDKKRIGQKADLSAKDLNGYAFLDEIIKGAPKGEYISYTFNNPTTGKDAEKIAFSIYVPELKWTVGTGVYTDELKQQIAEIEAEGDVTINGLLMNLIVASIILLAITVFAVIFFGNKIFVNPISTLQNGLLGFFNYLNRKTNSVEMIKLNSNDELGSMANVINSNIVNIQKGIEQDKRIIDETIIALGNLQKGDMSQRVTLTANNPVLNELKVVLNTMGETLESNISNMLNVLDTYSKFNYLNKVKTDGIDKHFLSLANGINLLGDSITSMLVSNQTNGTTLQESSTSLLKNVDKLNRSSNEAAASLEETAAALEEITSNIRNNTHNIAKMSNIATDVTTSAHEGEKLASDTTIAMEEINEQVNSINEAISVIDQIAFQTNILSLNAAVEAATAGEAGKGFAVVAQEVRNLASRSAEAAKEIKELVENATSKANEGKSIATNMIKGYEELNSHILQTIDLIKNVESSSKEQLIGIEQINNAVAQLDLQTQENASIAAATQEVATSTDNIANLIVDYVREKEFKGKI